MTRPNVREQILDAGLKSLWERGFNAVGVQEITALAGVPKGSFYNHFASKEALGAAVVERYAEAAETRRATLNNRALPPMERLRKHFEITIAQFVASDFKRGCMLGNFSAELSTQSALIRDSLHALFQRWTGELAIAIEDAQKARAIKTKTPASDLAAFLLDAFEGALLRARVERSVKPFDRFLQLAFEQILI